MSNPLHDLSGTTGSQGKSSGNYPSAQQFADPTSMQKFQFFRKYDVIETSYHFFSEKIDLHFCDDPGRKLFGFFSMHTFYKINVY